MCTSHFIASSVCGFNPRGKQAITIIESGALLVIAEEEMDGSSSNRFTEMRVRYGSFQKTVTCVPALVIMWHMAGNALLPSICLMRR